MHHQASVKLSIVRDLKRLTVIAVLACPVLAACGGGQPHSAAPSRSAVTVALRGSPAPLATLHDQANRLLPGGTAAFQAQLRRLHGHPIVVNKWASWCGPCQTEFPAFQHAAVRYGRQVAFIGLDSQDSDGSARAFLRRFPVTYPSFVDPHQSIADAAHAPQGLPMTVYYTARGTYTYTHAGPYASAAALERDIRQYVLR